MATLTPYNPALISSSPAKPMGYRDVYVETSQTYNAGMFLKVVSGLAKICTTSAATGVGADAVQLYALTTLAVATGDNTTVKTYGVVHEDDIYAIHLSTAITADRTISGQKYELSVTSTTLCSAVAGATNAVMLALNPVWTQRIFSDDSSDTYARIFVKVLSGAIYTQAA